VDVVTEPSAGPVLATAIHDVFLIVPQPIHDERGWFTRTLDLDWCRDAGLGSEFVHHNQSRSPRGVLRGLHVRAGDGETKLVRCARGAIVEHVVDTRPWSPTFRHVERIELDDVELVQLYLPPFVAHGFQVVSEIADVCYLHSRPYEPGADLSIAWNDPSLDLDWPILPPLTSARDGSAPLLEAIDFETVFDRS